MTDAKKTWLTDGQGNHALVTAAERDRWVPLGWTDSDEPAEGFIQVWHQDNEKPGLAPVALFRLSLEANGWVAGPPEGSDHPFAAAPAPAKSAKAAAGDEKE